ncbi:hypothetical protein LCGC14_0195290 [marine sediment metagenome]|uniref:Uncharacterized protein n=1 Tax=marine sediment metagenome TaxID=412755 RepID=A0A0F9X4C2_9ZZZZ
MSKTKILILVSLIVLMLIGLIMALFYDPLFGLGLMFVSALLIEHLEEKDPILKLWKIPCPRCTFYSLALIQPDKKQSTCDCGCSDLSEYNVQCQACHHYLWDDNTQKVIDFTLKSMILKG